MNAFKLVLGSSLLLVVTAGCDRLYDVPAYTGSGNQEQKDLLSHIRQENDENQQAVFQYMLFVDSVDKVLNNAVIDYIMLQNTERKKRPDKKQELLERLNILVNRLNGDESQIKSLEKKIGAKNGPYYNIVQALKKERLLQIERIGRLQNQIDSLSAAVGKQENKLRKKEKLIRQQEKALQHQKDTITEQSRQLADVRKILEKKYIILVSRKTTKRVELTGKFIIIPVKKKKIRLRLPDKEYCSLVSLSNSRTKLIVNGSYWRNNRILTVRVSGRF